MSNFTSGDLDEQDLKDIAAAAAEHDAAHGTDGNQPLHEQPAVAAPAVAPAVAPAAAPAATPAAAPQPFPTATPAQAPAAPALAPTPADPAAAPAPTPTTETQDKSQGDVRAALRASRRSEHRTRQENDRLKGELEELKKKVGVTTDGVLPAEVMKDVETYAPEAAQHIKKLEERIAATAPAQAPADPEFRPIYFPPEVQDLIDDIPTLAAWHANPDQTAFNLARRADALLQQSPAWKDQPETDEVVKARLAEAVKIAQQQMGKPSAPAPSPTDPAAIAAAAIAAAPVVQAPPSIGGMGSGTQPQPLKPDYSKMTDEEILALPE